MSAEGLFLHTIVFPDPELSGINQAYDDVNPDISYTYNTTDSIRTLSTNGLPEEDLAKGLLFVPELTTDACKNETADLIPANVTRRINLSARDYKLIAVAPWVRPECVLDFFNGTRATATHGFIFYLPDNSTQAPPMANDPVWGLNDGGQWKSDNIYPVWAIPGMAGATLMQNLALYSGNLTQVPNGHDLAGQYPPSEFVRLYGIVQLGDRSTLPSLWVFLLITLGLLVLIVLIISFVLHIVQRKRRQALRRRIINGEVDLEALGIKRLTVPQETLDAMPTYPYQPEDTTTDISEAPKEYFQPGDVPADSTSSLHETSQVAYSQPSCAICLDEYEIGQTMVRELPCRHIFHPNCVDEYLLTSSSLCPACRHSALPAGYCPSVITNSMVRRERLARRQRERAGTTPAMSESGVNNHGSVTGPRAALRGAFRSLRTGGWRSPHAPLPSRRTGSIGPGDYAAFPQQSNVVRHDVEMAYTPAPLTQPATTLDSQFAPPPSAAPRTQTTPYDESCPRPGPEDRQGRREWARQRALQLLGSRHRGHNAEEPDEQHRGPLGKFFSKIFPTT